MAQPHWNNARTRQTYLDNEIFWNPKFPAQEIRNPHVLSSYTENLRELTSPAGQNVVELPVLQPKDEARERFKVAIPPRAHDETNRVYLIRDDPTQHERIYEVWVGIDLDRFGPIDSAERFFQCWDMALLSERVIFQEKRPPHEPAAPARSVWIGMVGHFGNMYDVTDRKWLINGAKRQVNVLKKLWERGDLRIVEEFYYDMDTLLKAWAKRRIATGYDFHYNDMNEKDYLSSLIFPELWEHVFKTPEEKRDHCVIV